MFVEAIEDILRDQCTPAVVRAIESGESPETLWRSISDAGFLDLMAPEEAGGAGLRLQNVFPVLLQLGRYAMPLPFAQSIMARALLSGAEASSAGMLTFAPTMVRSGNSLRCQVVPYGALADSVLVSDGEALWLLPTAAAERSQVDLRAQTATLTWPDMAKARQLPGDAASLAPLAAATYAALLAGAQQRVFQLTLDYCNERQQFGRTLGKFQAVQHTLSVMAQHVAAASIAAEAAFQAAEVPSWIPAAIAKSRTSEAVCVVADSAHALHGAIGVTEEFDLQLLTRRLHGWRRAHGSEGYWNRLLGESLLADSRSLSAFARTTTSEAA